jgi:hypothetical protein
MTNREGLNKLKELSNQLDKVEYDIIVDILKNHIKRIPVPLAKLRVNSKVDRARKNIGDDLFNSVDELSYIKRQEDIDNHLKEFGRVNMPYQSIFYGAIESTIIKHQRITAIAETSKLFQDINGVNMHGELYTISRWANKVELNIVEVVFSRDAIKINPDIKKAFQMQMEFVKKVGQDDLEFYEDFLIFISEEFARPIISHHDYKISTAYANLVFKHKLVQGISFPSVQTKYVGENIAFEPHIIDEFFEIEALVTQKLYKNKMKIFLGNHQNCSNPKETYHELKWTNTDSKNLQPKEFIQNMLMT